jgi:hypothetical protein
MLAAAKAAATSRPTLIASEGTERRGFESRMLSGALAAGQSRRPTTNGWESLTCQRRGAFAQLGINGLTDTDWGVWRAVQSAVRTPLAVDVAGGVADVSAWGCQVRGVRKMVGTVAEGSSGRTTQRAQG